MEYQVVDFDDTVSDIFESGPKKILKSISDIVQYRAFNEPDKVAFTYLFDGVDNTLSWTYIDLQNAIAHVALVLNENINKGDRVLLLFEPGLHFIAAYLATISSGAIAVPCHPPMGNVQIKRLINMIQDCRPSLLLHSTVIAQTAPHLKQLATINNNHPMKLKLIDIPDDLENIDWRPAKLRLDDLAMLQYTSGSTGDPKGVMVTQDNLVRNCEAIYNWLGEYEKRKGCIWLPPYHDMGLLGGIMQPLYAGFPLVFMSPMHFIQSPLRWLKAISDHRLTTTGAPNFAFQLCIDDISDKDLSDADLDLSCIREIFCGSEPINPKTVSLFLKRFKKYGLSSTAINPCYGLAETTLFIAGKKSNTNVKIEKFSSNKLDQGIAVKSNLKNSESRSIVSCGLTGYGLSVQIVDTEMRAPIAAGRVGEIWVSGGSVTKGYWEKNELTKIAFNNNLPAMQGLYYRTGDLGFLHNNELFVTGRSKEVVIIRGRNLYPQDIERCLLASSQLLEKSIAAAFSVEGEGTEKLIVVIALKSDINLEEREQLKLKISAAVATGFNVTPDYIHIGPRKTVPRTTSGKIQRRACRDLFLKNKLLMFTADRDKK
ncbi:MAG: acyl-CoA synthetase (AMP-forming)/AMP-acid ligase II [Bermanella sp.]|jgi:acyl-CoA synthetase (AMP-forming)/AMP-acid ligase II